MNRRSLCILLVLVACFSTVLSKELDGSMKDSNNKEIGSAKDAAPTGNFSTATSSEEKKPDESAAPAKGAHSTDLFSTIGALTMAAVYIA